MKRIIIGMAVLLSGTMLYAQRPVDVHTHIILPEYKELLQQHGAELEETFPICGNVPVAQCVPAVQYQTGK